MVVDANAVVAGTIAAQLLEAVAGWPAQVLYVLCGVEHAELA